LSVTIGQRVRDTRRRVGGGGVGDVHLAIVFWLAVSSEESASVGVSEVAVILCAGHGW
jgi:hypothetical protein